jgi:Ser/Thr protein kinase RdoA (MazF antagonist)
VRKAKPANAAVKGPKDKEEASAPYAGLTPDVMLDALQSVGYRGDGRLLVRAQQLRKSRVPGVVRGRSPPVVAKFYRPQRWSDAQIREEHAFVAELAENEIPVVAPLPGARGKTLHVHEGFRFAVYPKRGGRAPELDIRATRQWLGRFIVVASMRQGPCAHSLRGRRSMSRPSARSRATTSLRTICFRPISSRPIAGVVDQALTGVRRCYERAR